jgi:endoglucanase
VAVLAALPATSVYVDAGNSGWVPAAEMAARLRDVGVERARGIALNVANFNATATEIAYGKAVLAALRVPGTRLVIDTGRNGQGPAPAAAHCNPPGRGLGHAPTADTGDPAVDAFFWFKRPGESDDNGAGCSDAGPAPPSGDFWPDYALGLAQRSAM